MTYSTKQQQAVLHCLETRREDTLTANDLAEDLRRSGSPVGLATIYRQLERLEKAGRVHKVNTGEGAVYQYCPHQEEAGCVLLRCSGCGHITHLNCDHLQSLREHLAQSHHFRIDTCHTVLSGLCGSCMEQEVPHGAH